MSQNISGFGLSVSILASNTFPIGLIITDFADDVDPFDFPEITIGDSKMSPNGELIFWSSATPIFVNLAVIPNSYSDIQLSILLQNNMVGANKVSSNDVITMTAIYPNNPESTLVLSGGKIVKGIPSIGMSGTGRQKTKTYGFVFESKTGGL